MPARIGRVLVLLAVVGGVALAVTFRDRLDVAALQLWVDGAGAAAPALFIALYALAAVLFLPGSVMTLAGGALFGFWWGTLFNLAGATLGATLAFLIARYLATGWVQSRIADGAGRTAKLIRGVEAEGWRFVALTRLVPLFPFNLLNYALGLTRIPLHHFVWASALFMLPGAAAYTFLGYAGREALGGGKDLVDKALIALALLAGVAFLPRLVARLRTQGMIDVDALRRHMEDAQGTVLDVRSAADFDGEQGHLAGALNLPLEELATRIGELGDDPEHPIAIVCCTDRRSAKAAALLARNGFARARVVRGGMTAWNARGWPVQRDRA